MNGGDRAERFREPGQFGERGGAVVGAGEQPAGEDVDEDDTAVDHPDALAQLQAVRPLRGRRSGRHRPASADGRTASRKARVRSRSASVLPPSAASPISGEPTPTAVAPRAR